MMKSDGIIRTIATACLEQGRLHSQNSDNLAAFGRWVPAARRASLVRSAALDSPLQLFAVADGQDGTGQGARAAESALALLGTFSERLPEHVQDVAAWRRAHLVQANRTVEQLLDPNHDMPAGTTLTALLLHGGMAYTLSIGNSRAYLFRDGILARLTRDDVAWLDETRYLTRWLGMQDETKLADAQGPVQTELKQGDVFILTTDGVTDLIGDEAIAACLAAPDAFVQRIGRIRELAIGKGAPDDFALVGIRVRDPDGKQPAGKSVRRKHEPGSGKADMLEQSLTEHRWIRPLSVFLFFVLLGLLLGKILTSLPGWFWTLLPGG